MKANVTTAKQEQPEIKELKRPAKTVYFLIVSIGDGDEEKTIVINTGEKTFNTVKSWENEQTSLDTPKQQDNKMENSNKPRK